MDMPFRGTRFRRCVAGLLAVAAVVAIPSSASAGSRPQVRPARTAGGGGKYGYVWANDPTNPSYTPDPQFQANSSGLLNTITRVSVGNYQVTFPSLAGLTNGGTVSVTAYGSGGRSYCGVLSWGGSPDIVVYVRCADSNGSPADSMFDATYTERTKTAARYGYVWADQPASPSYTPSLFYQFNSKGATNTITRSGTGSYIVTMPGIGLGNNSGTVKVTTYASASNRCKVGNWGEVGADRLVAVYCFDSFGTPVDAMYTVTFANKLNLLGSGAGYGYALANKPTSPSCTPDPAYSLSKPAGPITITRSARGSYEVTFAGVGLAIKSDVQVTSAGPSSHECRTDGWEPSGTGQGIFVECYDTNRNLADDKFTIQFIR